MSTGHCHGCGTYLGARVRCSLPWCPSHTRRERESADEGLPAEGERARVMAQLTQEGKQRRLTAEEKLLLARLALRNIWDMSREDAEEIVAVIDKE